jgi:hypothetical protein
MRDSNRLVVTRSGRRERDGAAHANPASRAFMGGRPWGSSVSASLGSELFIAARSRHDADLPSPCFSLRLDPERTNPIRRLLIPGSTGRFLDRPR